MQNWVKFCDIKKVHYKTKNLVTCKCARFFLQNDSFFLINGKIVYLIPPEIDIPRRYNIKSIKVRESKKCIIDIELDYEFSKQDLSCLPGKSLLLIEQEVLEVFGNLPTKNDDNILIGKLVKDTNQNNIGVVKSIDGTDLQKHLIVEHNEQETYIPYVDEIIKEINEDYIFVDLPEGILELNRK